MPFFPIEPISRLWAQEEPAAGIRKKEKVARHVGSGQCGAKLCVADPKYVYSLPGSDLSQSRIHENRLQCQVRKERIDRKRSSKLFYA